MARAKKMLIIDSEPGKSNVLYHQLRKKGYSALVAKDYKDGLCMMRKIKDIGLIMLNIESPGESGLDFYDTVKREFPRLKIIISGEMPLEEQKFLVSDADDYFCSFEQTSSFIDKVSRLLEK